MAGALHGTDFEAARARNKRNTILLFAVLLVIAAIMGYVLGWGIAVLKVIWSLPAEELRRLGFGGVLLTLFGPPLPAALAGAAIMAGASLAWGLITLFAGEHILASFSGARPADPQKPLEQQFIHVVEEMAIAAGVPSPTPMVVDTEALNAFASGYSPSRAMVTATSGILAACTREELQGVIGHEMGHVADYDVRYTTLVAAMAGVMVLVAHLLGDVLQWSFNWGGMVPYGVRGRSQDRDSGGAGGLRIALTLVVLVVLGIVLVVAPLASRLVQLAISRQREYLADANSVKLTRDPVGLIHALQRLAATDTAIARKDSPVAALCIAEPKDKAFSSFLSTHPPIPDRIARLRALGGITGPDDAWPPPPKPPEPPPEAPAAGPWSPAGGMAGGPTAGPWGPALPLPLPGGKWGPAAPPAAPSEPPADAPPEPPPGHGPWG